MLSLVLLLVLVLVLVPVLVRVIVLFRVIVLMLAIALVLVIVFPLIPGFSSAVTGGFGHGRERGAARVPEGGLVKWGCSASAVSTISRVAGVQGGAVAKLPSPRAPVRGPEEKKGTRHFSTAPVLDRPGFPAPNWSSKPLMGRDWERIFFPPGKNRKSEILAPLAFTICHHRSNCRSRLRACRNGRAPNHRNFATCP